MYHPVLSWITQDNHSPERYLHPWHAVPLRNALCPISNIAQTCGVSLNVFQRSFETTCYTVSVHCICRSANTGFTRDFGVVTAMLMQIPIFWDTTLCRSVITRQSRRNLLLSFATFPMPQNSRCMYTYCRSAATVRLEYMYQCWVGALKWTLDSYSCIKGGSGRQRTAREDSEHHTSGAVHLSRYIKLHVSLMPPPPKKKRKVSSGKNSRICVQRIVLGARYYSVLLTLRYFLPYQPSQAAQRYTYMSSIISRTTQEIRTIFPFQNVPLWE